MAASFIAVVILVVLLILLRNRFSQKKGEEQKVYETKIYNFIRDNNITDDMYFSNVLENEGGPDINYAKVIALNKTESVIEIVVFPTYQKWQVEKREEPIIQKVAFADIIEVRALSNSRIIVSTIKGSQFGRKNSRFSNERILNNSSKRLTLEIVVNSKSNSVIEIPFYDSKVWELVAGVEKHEKIARDLKYWYREISEILDPNNSYSNQEYAEEDESPWFNFGI
ncbi:hypothetical protein ACA29_13710 [Lederbergia galactosidilytica]|uniref:Uncharacterized protein n=1 Tax=Lederbergia galactosidilytica TaxID=217031 RepID=A0A0Q9XT60_9BACI|nr:hypothetical protein ACA29_13710 [Lederbergia galactosidilytica]